MPRSINSPNTSETTTLHASAARTASGTTSAVSGYGRTSMMRAQLNVTAATGTAPTLDVVLEDTIDGSNWNTIASFTQATAVTRQVINVPAPFGDQVRVRYTVGGTTPSFTFTVLVYTQ